MNDFTKDELIELNSCVYDHVRFKDSSMQDILLAKIKSMIDNYCNECDGKGKIDNLCDGLKGCCIYTCSNCKGKGKIEDE